VQQPGVSSGSRTVLFNCGRNRCCLLGARGCLSLAVVAGWLLEPAVAGKCSVCGDQHCSWGGPTLLGCVHAWTFSLQAHFLTCWHLEGMTHVHLASACVSVSIFEFSDETPPFFLDADSPC
jgi:hypothetical protein